MRPVVGGFTAERAGPIKRAAPALDVPAAALAPLLAGAYARGMADMLEGIGVPALFLRRDGRVLFANGTARASLSGGLRLEAEHIVAHGAEDNRRLGRLLATGTESRRPACERFDDPKSGASTLHLLPLEIDPGSGGQIVDAIVLLDPETDPVLTAVVARMTAMQGLGRLPRLGS